MNSKLIAIVPAAGVGARARTDMPKQYQTVNGQTILRRAVSAVLADQRVDQVRVAVAAGDTRVAQALHGLPRTVWRPCGGATRAATVARALADADLADDDWVLVHDAARPGLPADALDRLISTCLSTGHGGLLAVRVADTVKRESTAADNGSNSVFASEEATGARSGISGKTQVQRVEQSVSRDGLWLAQTPQMFPAGLLKRALDQAIAARHAITDEASAVELLGYPPLLIPGSMRNFKVTWPEDIELMGKWL